MTRWKSGHRRGVRKPDRKAPGLHVEGLESRCLLAVTINEFPVLTANSAPLGIVSGPDGNLWFTEQFAARIGQINPTTHAIAEFITPTAGSHPAGITRGPDGNLWFTEGGVGGGRIGMINPTTHAIAEFVTPTASSNPAAITLGPDGNLWFTEIDANRIGQINPTTHAIAEFPIPTAGSNPFGIAAGADGNLWFTEGSAGANKIGMINPTTHAFAEFPVPTARSQPDNIAAGADGNLWFTESQGNKIGTINPTTHAIAEFATPTANSDPIGITAGPDGNLWFTEINADQIGQINPTTHAFAEFPVPSAQESLDLGITTGPDGNLWFPIPAANVIAQAVLGAAARTGTTTQLVSSANPSSLDQPVTFTAIVRPQSGAGTPTGTVTFFVDGQAQTPVGLSPVGGLEEAAFTSTSLTAGNHTVIAAYSGNPTFDRSMSLPLAQRVNTTGAGPRVVGVDRFGFHRSPTTLVLRFDQPLDPTRAQDLASYRLIAQAGQRLVPFFAALYNPATETVTLFPQHLLRLRSHYQLTVFGTPPTGLTNASGQFLEGAGPGMPGTDFVTTITQQNLVLPVDPPPSPALTVTHHLARHSRAPIQLADAAPIHSARPAFAILARRHG